AITPGAAMLSGRASAPLRNSLLQPLLGIERGSALAHLEVQDRSLERARVSRPRDLRPGLDVLTDPDVDLGEVPVEREVAVAVVQDDHLPVCAVVLAGVLDAAAGHR